MLKIKQELLAGLAATLDQLLPGAGDKAAFESPKVAAHGDFAVTAAMQLAKPLKANPRQVGEQIRAALLAGADADAQARIDDYGAHIGAAFQIVDDILDEVGDEAEIGKPVGSDAEQGKTTYPSLLGIERSRALARERADAAMERLSPYSGPDADFLRSLASYIVDRAS